MSTKEKMLGKESNNKKAHRRYSLLLLALLFIGFATYGTYAYFTSSASTTKGHLTLNGTTGSYNFGTTSASSGDGLATNGEHQYTGATTDGSGNVTTPGNFDGNAATEDYSKKIAEFDWVYTGNKNETIGEDLSDSNPTALGSYNSAIKFGDIKGGRQFDNVTGGDVFRKTVRLAVSSTNENDKQEANFNVAWADTTGTLNLGNLSFAKMYVRTGSVKDNKVETVNDGVKTADLGVSTSIDGKITPNQYIEVDLVVQVNNNTDKLTSTNDVLAQIARQIKVTVSQNTAIKSMSSATAQSN